MTLELRPKGRGNWATLTMTLAGRVPFLPLAIGRVIVLDGRSYRVVRVMP